MDLLVLVRKVFIKNIIISIKVRGEIISTHQPYQANEKWESTFSCGSDQFVEMKFDTMDFSQIALDILRIQLLTEDLSMPFESLVFNKEILEPRDFYDLRYINHFVKKYKWFTTSYPAVRVLFDANNVRPFNKAADQNIQPLNYYGLLLRLKCSSKFSVKI